MLRLADDWTWDFWLADDGRAYHLYFLQAPRRLGDPDARHWNATVGHATSADLADWTMVADALAPGEGFGHLEVTQVEIVEGRPVLIFSNRGPGGRFIGELTDPMPVRWATSTSLIPDPTAREVSSWHR